MRRQLLFDLKKELNFNDNFFENKFNILMSYIMIIWIYFLKIQF